MRPVYEFRPHMRSINLEEASIFKQIPANKGRQRKAGVPIVIIESKSGTIRKVARTKSARESARVMKTTLRSLNGLKGQVKTTPVVEVVKPVKKTKWVITKVQKVMRTGISNNNRVVMFKLTNNKGVRKYFVSRKAAMLFRDNQPK